MQLSNCIQIYHLVKLQVLKQLHVVDLSVEVWLLILCPVLILFTMIRNLSSLAWISTFANCLMGFAIVSIFFYLIPHSGSLSGLPMFAGWSVFPLFFGVAVFAFESIPIVSIWLTYFAYVSAIIGVLVQNIAEAISKNELLKSLWWETWASNNACMHSFYSN